MSAQTEEEMRLGNVVHDLRAKLVAAEETIRKLHSIAWPRGGDLNGDPECDLLLMVGTFKCTISELGTKLAASEKERDEAVMLNRRIETVEQSAAERIDRAEANDSLSRKGWQDALAQVATLTAERDEWQRLSGMDCDGMNCPPSEKLKAERDARDLKVAEAVREELCDSFNSGDDGMEAKEAMRLVDLTAALKEINK